MYKNAHDSIIYNSQELEQPKYPQRVKQRNRQWYGHLMEYYTAVKINKMPLLTTMWLNRTNLTLSKNKVRHEREHNV